MRRHRRLKKDILIPKKDIQTKFITEDDIAQWVNNQEGLVLSRKIDNQNNVNFENIKLVCLTGCGNFINRFFNILIDKITNNVTLILIEADRIKLSIEQIEHKKINKIFMWNKNLDHKKVNCLPIGLNKDRHINLINLEKKDKNPTKLLLINYDANSHSVRDRLLNKARTEWKSFCDIKNSLPVEKHYNIKSYAEGSLGVGVTCKKYYELLEDYKFVLSPRGGGEDCHRTWEALYMGRIPIVVSSSIDEIYQDLPVLVLKNWNEINEDLLNKTWKEFKEREWNLNKLTLNFWMEKIMGKKFHFITYANHVFEKAKQRLLKEAKNFDIFTSVDGYGPENISVDFKEEYKDILSMNRGGGYWSWKFDIIKQEMDKLNENDLLLYIDAGCQLNKNGMKKFNEYVDKLEKSKYGILSFQMHDQMEKIWTTKEIFNYYNVSLESDIANSGQYIATFYLIKKNNHSIKFIDFMLNIMKEDKYLITDKYNKNQEKFFIDNRHDQSLSSIYRKLNGSVVIPRDESFHPQPFGCPESLNYPIWAKRRKY